MNKQVTDETKAHEINLKPGQRKRMSFLNMNLDNSEALLIGSCRENNKECQEHSNMTNRAKSKQIYFNQARANLTEKEPMDIFEGLNRKEERKLLNKEHGRIINKLSSILDSINDSDKGDKHIDIFKSVFKAKTEFEYPKLRRRSDTRELYRRGMNTYDSLMLKGQQTLSNQQVKKIEKSSTNAKFNSVPKSFYNNTFSGSSDDTVKKGRQSLSQTNLNKTKFSKKTFSKCSEEDIIISEKESPPQKKGSTKSKQSFKLKLGENQYDFAEIDTPKRIRTESNKKKSTKSKKAYVVTPSKHPNKKSSFVEIDFGLTEKEIKNKNLNTNPFGRMKNLAIVKSTNSLQKSRSTSNKNLNFISGGIDPLNKKTLPENMLTPPSSDSENLKIKESKRKLFKKKLVYDSFSDEEVEIIETPFYIHPDSYFKFYLDMLVMICSCMTMLLTPLSLAFYYEESLQFRQFLFWGQVVVDVIFCVDFLTGFFLAFFDFEEHLITSYQRMLLNYLFTWLLFDLISAFPLNTILASLNLISNFDSPIHIGYNLIDSKSPLMKIITMLRNLKMIKLIKNNKFVENIYSKLFEEVNISATLSRLLKFISYFFVVTHLLACIFIYLGQITAPNWIMNSNLQNDNDYDIYIASTYFILCTIFTIGYGDIVSINIYERFYNLLLLMVGILIYSYAVSSLSNIIQYQDEKIVRYNKRVEYLEDLKLKYSLPSNLLEKIYRFLKYEMNTNKGDKNDFLEDLPKSLKNEMILRMYRPIISNFHFFRHFNNVDFIIKAIIALKPYSAIKNERLVKEGDFLEEMIFIKTGTLVLEVGIKVVTEHFEEDNPDEQGTSRKEDKNSLTKTIVPSNNEKKLKFCNTYKYDNKCKSTSFFKKTFAKTFNTIADVKNVAEEDISEENSDRNPGMKYLETQFLKIIELRRNEHFGDVLMILNRRSPLSVRVKTKVAELYFIKKTDLLDISTNFPDIFNRISRKSAFNQRQLDLLIKRTKLTFYENHKDEFLMHPDEEEKLISLHKNNLGMKSVFNRNSFSITPINVNLTKTSSKVHKTGTKINCKGTMTFSYPLEKNDFRRHSESFKLHSIPSNDSVKTEDLKKFDISKNEEIPFDNSKSSNKSDSQHGMEHSYQPDDVKHTITEKSMEDSISVDSNPSMSQPNSSGCSPKAKKEVFKLNTILTEETEINKSGFKNLNRIIPYLDTYSKNSSDRYIDSKESPPSSDCSERQQVKISNKHYPIMYNFNISNNYNFDGKESKQFECPNCKCQGVMLTNQRAKITYDGGKDDKEFATWVGLQISESISFSIAKGSSVNVSRLIKTKTNRRINSNAVKKSGMSEASNKRPSSAAKHPMSQEVRHNQIRDSLFSISSLNKNIMNTPLDLNKRKSSIFIFNQQKENFFTPSRDLKSDSMVNSISKAPRILKTLKKNKLNDEVISEMNKNIEKSQLNLNDPEFFYSELFQEVMIKKHNSRQKREQITNTENLNKRLDELEKLFLELK